MNIKINPYIKSLIKENGIYILINVGLIIIISFFLIYNLKQIPEKQAKINTLETEVQGLRNKANLVSSAINMSEEELTSSVKIFDALIPNSEDFFSIIYALEELSAKTNFIITSYTINLKQSSANKLQLIVSGVGDQNAFMDFLKEYNFGGGRLITCDKLELSSEFEGTLKLNINFYNKNISSGDQTSLSLNKKEQNEISEIINKVNFLLKEPSVDTSYPTKNNPF